MYKKASQLKLRVETKKGLLSVEDLWGLSMKSLAELCRVYHKKIQDAGTKTGDLGFLDESGTVDPGLELSFEILKDIWKTKKAESLEAADAISKKEQKQKLLAILKKKQEESLESLSEEELLKKIEALG